MARGEGEIRLQKKLPKTASFVEKFYVCCPYVRANLKLLKIICLKDFFYFGTFVT